MYSQISNFINNLLESYNLTDDLTELNDKTIKIAVTDTCYSIGISCLDNIISIQPNPDKWHCCIAAPITAFMLSSTISSQQAASFGLTVEGETYLAEALYKLQQNLQIDFTTILANYCDENCAFAAKGLHNRLNTYVIDSFTKIKESIIEYIQIELEAIADKDMLDEFATDVDTLSKDIERLSARYRMLV